MIRHFTATVYLIKNGKTLLHSHPKQKKWLPPGGHVEENETPPEAAIREALEETGLAIALFPQENIWIKTKEAVSFERPYLCLLETVPPHGNEPTHQHIDFIYVGYPLDDKIPKKEFHWIGQEDLDSLDLYPDTKEITLQILSAFSPSLHKI